MSIVVIIPHKNCPEKAHRLLNTIPIDVPVLVVDDNSDEYQFSRLNNNIEVYFRNTKLIKNTSYESNAGTARNVGIKNCPKDIEWIIFADADDKFDKKNFCSFQEFLSADKTSDVVFFNCMAKKEVDGAESSRCDNYKMLISDWPNTKEIIAASWPVPWGKAIRAKIIFEKPELRFSSRSAGNDIEFSAKLASLKPSVNVFSEIVYICYESNSSLTATLTPEKALDRLKANINCNEIFISSKVKRSHFNYCIKFFLVSAPLIVRRKELSTVFDFFKNAVKAFIANKRV